MVVKNQAFNVVYLYVFVVFLTRF